MDEIRFTKKNIHTFYNNFAERRVPVLIKGGISTWPLMKKWTKSYVVDTFGDYSCTVVNDSRSGVASKNNIKATLRDYFNNYLGESSFVRELYDLTNPPSFFRDIEMPNLFFSEENIASYFFFHARSLGGALPHVHPFEVFNLLQQGEKKWILYDADPSISPQANFLMQEYKEKYGANAYARDWFANELQVLPQQLSNVYECTQVAGDIVYIPVNFCHAVLNQSDVTGLIAEIKR